MGATLPAGSVAVIPRVTAPGQRNGVAPNTGIPQYNPNAPPGGSGTIPSQAIPGIVTNTGSVMPTPSAGTPTPGGPVAGGQCAPCSTTQGGIAGTYQTAVNAIRDESCLGKVPGIYATFPDN
jgi:hypothetical protein